MKHFKPKEELGEFLATHANVKTFDFTRKVIVPKELGNVEFVPLRLSSC
jgi:hypothetical protein